MLTQMRTSGGITGDIGADFGIDVVPAATNAVTQVVLQWTEVVVELLVDATLIRTAHTLIGRQVVVFATGFVMTNLVVASGTV